MPYAMKQTLTQSTVLADELFAENRTFVILRFYLHLNTRQAKVFYLRKTVENRKNLRFYLLH